MKSNLLNNTFDFILRKSENPAVVLIGLSAFGLFAGAASQIFAINSSKTIDPDKKKFLLSQEINEGVSNLGMFVLITSAFKKGAEKLVYSGKIMPPEIKETIETFSERANIKGGLEGFMRRAHMYDESITSLMYATDVGNDNFTRECIQKINKSKTAWGVVATLIGSIVASNIISPIIKNKMAAKALKKEQKLKVYDTLQNKSQLMAIPPVYNSSVFSPITKI